VKAKEPEIVKATGPSPLAEIYADPAFRREWDAAQLEHALMALESAAWSRSWTRLQQARRQVHGLTSIRLVGKLAKMLEEDE